MFYVFWSKVTIETQIPPLKLSISVGLIKNLNFKFLRNNEAVSTSFFENPNWRYHVNFQISLMMFKVQEMIRTLSDFH